MLLQASSASTVSVNDITVALRLFCPFGATGHSGWDTLGFVAQERLPLGGGTFHSKAPSTRALSSCPDCEMLLFMKLP